MINTLLEAGVDKDCATAEKWSPLHAAAEKGKLEAVRCLQVPIPGGSEPPKTRIFRNPNKDGCFGSRFFLVNNGITFRFHG